MDCALPCPSPASPGNEDGVVSQIGLTYLAEGAANVVYRISLSGTAARAHPQLVEKLFRLRKSTPSAVPCAKTVAHFQTRIAPLFPENNLVNLKLHHMSDQYALTTRLNEALRQREANGTRPTKRRGVFLAPVDEEPNQILVTDLSPRGPDEKLAEFKPKWLLQSPSAPATAKRCRTCALREMRTEDGRVTGMSQRGRGHVDFCPLDLLSDDNDVLKRVVKLLSLRFELVDTSIAIFREQVQPLLMRLRGLQAEYSYVGLHDFEQGHDQDFSVAMTLRDCSVFVKSRRDVARFQEVRLADLDVKTSLGGKLEAWASMERRLIEEGWYTGSETADSQGQRFCRALQGA